MFTRIYRVTILATGLNNELAEDIPESSSVSKDEEDYQRIIDKLYHPIRDNFQTLANKTEQKQEAESIDNINPDATEKEATIVHLEEMPGNESGNESGEEPAKVLVEDNPSTTEDSREVPVETPIAKPKSWTLGGRIKNGLKKIAEDLDIITYNDENYKQLMMINTRKEILVGNRGCVIRP